MLSRRAPPRMHTRTCAHHACAQARRRGINKWEGYTHRVCRDTTNKNDKKNEKKKTKRKKKKKEKEKRRERERERRWRRERHDEGCVTRGCSCNAAAAAFSGTHRTIARLFRWHARIISRSQTNAAE